MPVEVMGNPGKSNRAWNWLWPASMANWVRTEGGKHGGSPAMEEEEV